MQNRTLLPILFALILISCSSGQTLTPENSSIGNVAPTDEFSGKNAFGDGYISHVLINDVNSESPEKIVEVLVTQWLEHYKTGSTAEREMIKDFQLDEITLLERIKSDPSIVASVGFSIIPAQIPTDWASFPGDEIKPEDTWWRLYAPVGVYQDKDYFWLGLMFGRGT